MKTSLQRVDKSRAGFTAIEVVAALLVIGISAMFLTAGRWTSASAAAEAEVMRSHLRYVEALAMANNTATWSVRVFNSSYEIWRNGDLSEVSFPGENSPVYTFPEGVQIVSGTGVINFNTWGAPNADRNIVVSDGARSRTIRIFGFTGLIP
jgi:prepilin-type N-terminal cleavage/methylation domain-containing protein